MSISFCLKFQLLYTDKRATTWRRTSACTSPISELKVPYISYKWKTHCSQTDISNLECYKGFKLYGDNSSIIKVHSHFSIQKRVRQVPQLAQRWCIRVTLSWGEAIVWRCNCLNRSTRWRLRTFRFLWSCNLALQHRYGSFTFTNTHKFWQKWIHTSGHIPRTTGTTGEKVEPTKHCNSRVRRPTGLGLTHRLGLSRSLLPIFSFLLCLFAQPLFSLPRQFWVWHRFERQICTSARIEIPTIPVTQETGSQKSIFFNLSQLNKATTGLF
jgi:hypothetical protein